MATMRTSTYRKYESRLRRASKKLERASKKCKKELLEVDREMQTLPLQIKNTYNLERDYFKRVKPLARLSTKMESLNSSVIGLTPSRVFKARAKNAERKEIKEQK